MLSGEYTNLGETKVSSGKTFAIMSLIVYNNSDKRVTI